MKWEDIFDLCLKQAITGWSSLGRGRWDQLVFDKQFLSLDLVFLLFCQFFRLWLAEKW